MHPQVRSYLDAVAAQNRPAWEMLPPAESREWFASFKAMFGEGPSYANRLQLAGVPTTIRRYDGMIHGFVQFSGLFDGGRQAISDLAEHLQKVFGERTSI